MNSMTSKIKIKLGPIEVEYEGSEDFLKKDLPELISAISKSCRESGFTAPLPLPSGSGPLAHGGNKGAIGTTGTIAAKLKVSSGSDLALAAAARLSFGDRKGAFTRDELLNEMKNATSYYKKNYSNNLSKSLSALVKGGKFIETAKDTYALSAPTRTDLENRLAS